MYSKLISLAFVVGAASSVSADLVDRHEVLTDFVTKVVRSQERTRLLQNPLDAVAPCFKHYPAIDAWYKNIMKEATEGDNDGCFSEFTSGQGSVSNPAALTGSQEDSENVQGIVSGTITGAQETQICKIMSENKLLMCTLGFPFEEYMQLATDGKPECAAITSQIDSIPNAEDTLKAMKLSTSINDLKTGCAASGVTLAIPSHNAASALAPSLLVGAILTSCLAFLSMV
jgi:hypothetical protein